MKNLKKIAALVIVLAIALSSVSFAAFTDVAADASYNEAVEVMSALGLLKGYEDGTFGPDKTITRAEFAAVVVRMLGMEDAAAGAATATSFTDVPATHWAAGYVKIANQKAIIAGYGDGKFGPDDEVTYEQAVKMLVCALGYAPMFKDVADAYPTAYMAQANTLGMTVGATGKIGDKATRAIVARLTYNALDDKLMEQTGFGTDIEFKVPDANWSTPLSKYLKVAKIEADVNPVSFKLEDANKVKLSSINRKPDTSAEVIEAGNYDMVEGTVIPKGYKAYVYVDYNEGVDEAIVKAIVAKTGKNDVLTIVSDQAKDATVTMPTPYKAPEYEADGKTIKVPEVKAKAGDITYYVTSKEESNKTDKVVLDSEAKFYKNDDVSPATGSFAAEFVKGSYPEVTLINNDDDNDYDVVLYTEIASLYIDAINESRMRISTYKFDPELENQTYTLTNAEGKEIAFADIKVGDVLNVIKSTDGSNEKFDYIITSNVIEGSVSEISGNYAYINGEEYINDAAVGSGDKGKFYIDLVGKIKKFELDSSSNKFATIMAIYNSDNGAEDEIKVLLYTADGKYETCTFAKTVTINGTGYKSESFKLPEDSTKLEQLEYTTGKYIDANVPTVVMYAANSNNQINTLVVGSAIDTNSSNKYSFNKNALSAKVKYDAMDETYDGYTFAETATIIASEYKDNTFAAAGNPKSEKFSISSKTLFSDDVEYAVEYILDEDNEEIVYAIVFDAKAKVEPTNPVMYVTKNSSAQTEDGDPYVKVTGFVDDELVTISVDPNANIYRADGVADDGKGNFNYYTKGALIQYNEGDFTNAVRIIATGAEVAKMTQTTGEVIVTAEGYKDDDKGYLVAGKLLEAAGSSTVTVDYGTGSSKIRNDSSLIGVVAYTDGTAITDIYGGYAFADAENDKDATKEDPNEDVVIAYCFDGKTIAVVIIDTAKDND